MAQVLEFPTRESQAYAYLQRELRALLTAKGADEPLIDFAARTLRDIYSEVATSENEFFSVDLPTGVSADEAARLQQQITEAVEGLRQRHHTLLVTMAARLVLTELQLFQQRRIET